MEEIMEEIIYPKQGEPEGSVTPICARITGQHIIIPERFIQELGWKAGDIVDISKIDLCFDWGESEGLVLRNLSKEMKIVDNTD